MSGDWFSAPRNLFPHMFRPFEFVSFEISKRLRNKWKMEERGRRLWGEDAFRNKQILAPMVRCGTLPFRLLCSEYGVDIVYTDELIGYKLMKSQRRVLGDQIGYYSPNDPYPIFVTNALEKPLVLQIGAPNAKVALLAAQTVARDVDAIDVNACCPIHFSVSGGMGAALLRKPDVAEDILKTLVREIDLPITMKMRMIADPKENHEFMRRMMGSGIKALAVHARTVADTRKDPARWEELKMGLSYHALPDVPIILSGDAFAKGKDGLRQAQEAVGCDSIMYARGILRNPSIALDTPLPLLACMKRYWYYCTLVGNRVENSKYTLMRMATEKEILHHPKLRALSSARSVQEIRDLLESDIPFP